MNPKITVLEYTGANDEKGEIPLYAYTTPENNRDVYIIVETIDHVGPGFRGAETIDKVRSDITARRAAKDFGINRTEHYTFLLLGYSPHLDQDTFWEVDEKSGYWKLLDMTVVETDTIFPDTLEENAWTRDQLIEYLPEGVIVPNGNQIRSEDHIPNVEHYLPLNPDAAELVNIGIRSALNEKRYGYDGDIDLRGRGIDDLTHEEFGRFLVALDTRFQQLGEAGFFNPLKD